MMTAITTSTAASSVEDLSGTAVAASLYLSIEASMLNERNSSNSGDNMELLSRKRTASEEVTARAAATAARRKRRRALVRRTHSPKSARLSNQQRSGKRPAPKTENDDHEHDEDNTPNANHAHSNANRRRKITNITTIQPTIQGVQQEVPNRLLANETVAVPTECTYEACFRLWYKTSTSTNTSNNDDNNDDHTDNIPSASINNTSSITTHNSNDQRLEHQTVQHQREHQLAIPHVYVPPSLESTFLQSSLLRARRYAMRDKETNVVAQVCSFSETHQVLQRLSSKLWPGPVLIYVALDTESTVSPLLQTERNGVSYVALRSPCHPLAVKVCQEYERCVDQHRDADSTNNDLSAVLVGLPLLESSSTNNNSGSHGNNNNNEYVTSALRVGESAVAATVDCVLNGEERREIFAVPTCEHRRPWPISLWINGKDRQVTILDASASATATATSSSSSNDLPQPLNVESVLQAVRSRNYSSSSTRAKKSPGTVFRDRMVQTILAKWTVLKEED